MIRSATIVLLAGLLPGAELVVRDLQADLLLRPTAFDFSLSTPSYAASGTDAWKSGTAGELGYRHSFSRTGDPVGLVAGISGTTEAYLYNSDGYLVALTLRPSVGLGWTPVDRWTLIAETGYSYGLGQISLPASSAAPSFTASGRMTGFDLRVMSWWSASERIQLGAVLGYQRDTWTLSGDSGTDLTINQAGMYVGLGLAWRFSTDPVSLE